MAEEQEEKKKPKATLIKHKKTAPKSEVAEEEKKPRKVVVVRKKAPPKKVVVKSEASEKTEVKEPVREKTKPAPKKPAAKKAAAPAPAATDAKPKERPQEQARSAKPEPKLQQAEKPRTGLPEHKSDADSQKKRPLRSDRSSKLRIEGYTRNPVRRRHGDQVVRPRAETLGRVAQVDPAGPVDRPRAVRRDDHRVARRWDDLKVGRRTVGPEEDRHQKVLHPNRAEEKFVRSKKKSGGGGYRREEQERDFQIKKRQNRPKTNPVPKEIDIMDVITVSELARKMNLKASEVIGKLMGMGMMVTINQQIDAETAQIVAAEYKCKVNIVSLYDETIIETEKDSEDDLDARPPIVTVMGHVDHGKTKLLDTIRSTDVVADEFGGITQHIGAYEVNVDGHQIVFLDTPGHEAFTLMRARGAQITDIVVLVVAADDGVMPQTVEAVNHAKEAGVPIIVAVNKIDLPDSNPDRVKQQLSEYNLIPEDWGGSTLFCEVSALDGTGVKELLDSIILQSDLLELKANFDCRAEGKIIESKVDHGRGIVGTVLVERGTLKVGDAFVAGVYPGKVRAMFDDKGKRIDEATPATPVEILGLTGIPDAGAPFQVTETERVARQVGSKRQELEKQGEAKNVKKITLDNLYDSIQDGAVQELKVIIKGDVHGSVEALQTALEKLSTDEIRLNVIHATAGAIIENDVNLASASNAIIIGFHVRPTPKALELAEREKVDVRKYNIIYNAVSEIQSAMEGMLAPDIHEEVIGSVEVRDVFKVPKIGLIAGCYVTSGKIRRNADVHIVRDGVEIHTGKVSSLKRFKDDAREVESGFECGVGVDNYLDIQEGDLIEVFETREVAKKLS